MKRNIKIMLRLILCIALAMTMLGCTGITLEDDVITSDDLQGTWKTSHTTTENGKTVTLDHYMEFGFKSLMETSVMKTTQGTQPAETISISESSESIRSYLYLGSMPRSITVKMDNSPSRIVTFYKWTKKNLYVGDNSDKVYTKFDGEIPKKGF